MFYYSTLMGLTPYHLENVLSTNHEIFWFKYIYIRLQPTVQIDMQVLLLPQKGEKKKLDSNLVAGTLTCDYSLLFVWIVMCFTSCCFQKSNVCLMKIDAKAAFAAGNTGWGSGPTCLHSSWVHCCCTSTGRMPQLWLEVWKYSPRDTLWLSCEGISEYYVNVMPLGCATPSICVLSYHWL